MYKTTAWSIVHEDRIIIDQTIWKLYHFTRLSLLNLIILIATTLNRCLDDPGHCVQYTHSSAIDTSHVKIPFELTSDRDDCHYIPTFDDHSINL